MLKIKKDFIETILKEEEHWAYSNQMAAVNDNNKKEVTWNRGFRCALREIAKRLEIKLEQK